MQGAGREARLVSDDAAGSADSAGRNLDSHIRGPGQVKIPEESRTWEEGRSRKRRDAERRNVEVGDRREGRAGWVKRAIGHEIQSFYAGSNLKFNLSALAPNLNLLEFRSRQSEEEALRPDDRSGDQSHMPLSSGSV